MRLSTILASVAAVALVLASCSDSPSSASGSDAGSGSLDVGSFDGGSQDSGPADAGGGNDGGNADAGMGMDGGGSSDAGMGMDGGMKPTVPIVQMVHAAYNIDEVWLFPEGENGRELMRVFSQGGIGSSISTDTLYAGQRGRKFVYDLTDRPGNLALLKVEITYPESGNVTLVLAGDKNATDPDKKLRVLTYYDEFDAKVAGQARVRFVNASELQSPLSVDIGDDGSNDITAIPRFGVSDPAGVLVPAGAETPLVIQRDSDGAHTKFTAAPMNDGTTGYLVAYGDIVGYQRYANPHMKSPSVTAVLSDGQSNVWPYHKFALLHAEPNLSAVDIFDGPRQLAENIDFGALSPHFQLPAGSRTLDVFPTSPGSARPATAPLRTASVGSYAGGYSLLVMVGNNTASAPFKFELVEDDDFPTNTSCKLELYHAAPDSAQLRIGYVANGAFTPQVPFPSNYLDMVFDKSTPEPFTFGVTDLNGTTPSVELPMTCPAGSLYKAFVVGKLGDAPAMRLSIVEMKALPWTLTTVP